MSTICRRIVLLSSICITLSATPFVAYAGSENTINIDQEQATLSALAPELNQNVLKLALTAYNNANKEGLVKNDKLTVIDYSLPSSKKRMWVFDLSNNTLLYNTYVAHGKNSGDLYAKHFSNTNQSKETSIGTFITKSSYTASHDGYALQIKGLDKGFNDHALSRGVIIHGAWYVSESFLKQNGRMGRSWGCPAISKNLVKPLINTIKNGSVLFSYYPDQKWLSSSKYLTA